MEIGVLTALYNNASFEEMLGAVAKRKIAYIELGTGGYPGNAHCNLNELLDKPASQKEYLEKIAAHNLKISALSCHSNPLHPNKEIAKEAQELIKKTVALANQLGVSVVNTFSGCPGDGKDAHYPNWVTCAWPPDFAEILKWQWEERLIPYWSQADKMAEDASVRFALELHPGFCVYNVGTMLKLRSACGDAIGCNFDPSHLFWNGVDASSAIRKLGEAIFHVHAKDCKLDMENIRVNGCNDTTNYGDIINRSWTFRTVGYGHGYEVWKDIVSSLRLIGYDFVLSIEHEDALMSVDEGFSKAVTFLKEVVITEPSAEMWWA